VRYGDKRNPAPATKGGSNAVPGGPYGFRTYVLGRKTLRSINGLLSALRLRSNVAGFYVAFQQSARFCTFLLWTSTDFTRSTAPR
jgi:hypothetical protein